MSGAVAGGEGNVDEFVYLRVELDPLSSRVLQVTSDQSHGISLSANLTRNH